MFEQITSHCSLCFVLHTRITTVEAIFKGYLFRDHLSLATSLLRSLTPTEHILTNFWPVDLSTFTIWVSLFLIPRAPGGCFILCCILHKNYRKQTVLILYRRRVLRRLYRVCTVCVKPPNGGLREVKDQLPLVVSFMCPIVWSVKIGLTFACMKKIIF